MPLSDGLCARLRGVQFLPVLQLHPDAAQVVEIMELYEAEKNLGMSVVDLTQPFLGLWYAIVYQGTRGPYSLTIWKKDDRPCVQIEDREKPVVIFLLPAVESN